jgi:hypothetical protein
MLENSMTIDEAVQRLAKFISSLRDFRVYEQHEIDTYDHMGAAIADAVLQAQRDYNSVVAPRTKRILRIWPDAKTVSSVLECLKTVPPSEFLDWNDKPGSKNYLAHRVQRFVEVLTLLKESGIETTSDLKQWLTEGGNSARLRTVYGVGAKTTEYIKILVGLQTAAPDARLRIFLAQAGVPSLGDAVDGEVINRTADALSIPRACLDHSIWQYVGSHKTGVTAASCMEI